MKMDNSTVSGPGPEGYHGHYTIVAGDTMALLASLFSISEEDLLRANPHITSAETLLPGTRINIPGLVPFPAGAVFGLTDRELPFGNGGGAFIHLSPEGGQSVSVIATLPASSYFGAYDLYIVEVLVTANNIFEGQLFATPDDPPSWAARIDLPFLTSLAPESRIDIRPFNSTTGKAGPVILTVDLSVGLNPDHMEVNTDLSITSEDFSDREETDKETALPGKDAFADGNTTNDEAEIFDDIPPLPSEEEQGYLSTDSPSDVQIVVETDDPAGETDGMTENPAGEDDLLIDDLTAESENRVRADSRREEPIMIDPDENGSEFTENAVAEDLTADSEPSLGETDLLPADENDFPDISDDPSGDDLDPADQNTDNEENLPVFEELTSGPVDEDVPPTAFDETANDLAAEEQNLDNAPSEPADPSALPVEDEPLQISADADTSEEILSPPTDSSDDLDEELPAGEENHSEGLKTNILYTDDERPVPSPDSLTTMPPADTMDSADLPADKILANYNRTARSPQSHQSNSSLKKNLRRPTNILLTAAPDSGYAVGVASIQLQPGQIIISALKLPDPSRLGPQYKYYKAWIIDAANNKTAAIDMKRILNGVWVGRSSQAALKAFDLVMVTAEEYPHAAKPIGPEVLIGILTNSV